MQMPEEAAQLADVSQVSTDEAGLQLLGRCNGKASKMPYFDENRDFMDSYLSCFEKFAICRRWNRVDWALYLLALPKSRNCWFYGMFFGDGKSNGVI